MTEPLDKSTTALTEVEAGNALADLMSQGDDFSEDEQNSPEPRPAKKAPAPAKADEPAPEADEDEDTQDEPEAEADPAADEAESDDAADEDDEPAAPRKIKVKDNGVEKWVTEEEAANGYMRNSDYTQKRQAESAAEKARATEFEAVKAERQRIAADLGSLEQILKTANGAEPDWDTLRQGDLSIFNATFADWSLKQKQLEGVAKMREEADRKVAADRLKDHNALVEAEAGKLKDLIPAWKDAKVAKKELAEVMDHARGMGYTDEHLNQITDARIFAFLRKSMLFDKANAPAVKEKIAKVRTAAPGSPAAPEAKGKKEARQAMARVAKSGSVEDGAAALLHFLD